MKKRDFLDAVEHEIKSLKENALPEEIAKLDFDKFDHESPFNCIYGQMTGTCASNRAKALMSKCCIKALDNSLEILKSGSPVFFKSIRDYVFKSNNKKSWTSVVRTFKFLSALEAYIYLKDAKNEHIISFLKGETKRLKL